MTMEIQHSGATSRAIAQFVPVLVADKVASRIFAKDHTLWGKEAESESAIRLGWVNAATESLNLIDEVEDLATTLSSMGLTRVVLCGMGGSSLAPEVITKTAGKHLVVLDSTEPSQVTEAISGDLEKTVVVVSSKSGSTVETDSQKRSFEKAFSDRGINPTERIFIVTDPDSPMHKAAVVDGYRVFLANPNVGGRYSALTAFGLVPSVLAGVQMRPILESAKAAAEKLSLDQPDNPGLQLGAAMARTASSTGYKDKLGLVPGMTSLVGFGDWAEQLIAESTGKLGKGVLPVVLVASSPETSANIDDLLLIEFADQSGESKFDLSVSGELGEQILLWEVATAVASRLLAVNPFDQPDVESAKVAARALLDSPGVSADFAFVDEGISVAAKGFELVSDNLESALAELLAKADQNSYFSIHAYLNRESATGAFKLRDVISQAIKRPTTFGWGPRFLHSTGQYHKGGPKQGVFLVLINGSAFDLEIPGRPFGYRSLISSQAIGDSNVLGSHGLPVLILSLTDLDRDIARISELLR